MLFYLTDTLIVEKTAPEYAAIRRAVKYIAMAVFESKHLLRGDYRVLGFMKDEFKNDKEIYPIFHQLVSKYSTYTVPDDICRYIEVVREGFGDYEKDGHFIKQIEYNYFNDSKKVQAMTIVAEDVDDCALFEYVLNWYIKQNNLPYNYCYKAQGGGGSRIKTTVMTSLSSGDMVTCITDSDQRYKGQPLDPHSNCVECGKLKFKDKIYYFLCLPVLELENLVPMNHYDLLNWSQKQNRLDKQAFERLRNNKKAEHILPYFDIKEGLKKVHIKQFGDGFIEYARMCCKCNPSVMKGMKFEDYVDNLKDQELIYPRLKNRPMKELAPLYKKGVLPDPGLMVFQLDAWIEIGSLLLDTLCARNEEAITV